MGVPLLRLPLTTARAVDVAGAEGRIARQPVGSRWRSAPPAAPAAPGDRTPWRCRKLTTTREDYFGSGPVSLQFTFVVSPFLHFCLCDCCSFAEREVSFSPELGFVADMLESDDELEESVGEVLVSGGGELLVSAGGDVEEFAGAF